MTESSATPTQEAPEGFHYEWVRDDSFEMAWLDRTCRQLRCGEPAVVALKRRHGTSPFGFRWWFYCAEHMYGRKIDDGVVKMRRLVQNEVPND